MHRATLRLAFADAGEARAMLGALTPDDDGHAQLRAEGPALVIDARSTTALGLLRTLDELVAALAAAQKAGDLASR